MNTAARELIRERMEKRNISQVDLADRLSMTSSQISRILSGERGTTLENILAIADVLGIERDYLLRLAAGLKLEPGEDPWVDEMAGKLRTLRPGLRSIAENVINSMVEGEETEVAGNVQRMRTTQRRSLKG